MIDRARGAIIGSALGDAIGIYTGWSAMLPDFVFLCDGSQPLYGRIHDSSAGSTGLWRFANILFDGPGHGTLPGLPPMQVFVF